MKGLGYVDTLIDQTHSMEIVREISEELGEVVKERVGTFTPPQASKKRNREAFENFAEAKILNLDERLQELKEAQEGGKTKNPLKKTKVTKEKKKPDGEEEKEMISIPKNFGRSEDQPCLNDMIPNLDNLPEIATEFVTENTSMYTFELRLPFSFETLNLSSKYDIVFFFFFLNYEIYRICCWQPSQKKYLSRLTESQGKWRKANKSKLEKIMSLNLPTNPHHNQLLLSFLF